MTNESDTRGELTGNSAVNRSQQRGFNEEVSAENLAKAAIQETIREGGAFAPENPNQFKQ